MPLRSVAVAFRMALCAVASRLLFWPSVFALELQVTTETDNRQKLAKILLGSGMASRAADKQSRRADYDREASETLARGEPMPSFDEWEKSKKK